MTQFLRDGYVHIATPKLIAVMAPHAQYLSQFSINKEVRIETANHSSRIS
jgi:hypothetical protein